MVLCTYKDFDDSYEWIKQTACGRQACSVLILVSMEIDSLASARMFTQVLKRDHIPHSLAPVSCTLSMRETLRQYGTDDLRVLMLINCGGTADLTKLLDLNNQKNPKYNKKYGGPSYSLHPDLRVFVFDHHRPIHLSNVSSKYRVNVFENLHNYFPHDLHKYLHMNGSEVEGETEVQVEVPEDYSDYSLDSDEEDSDSDEDFDEEADEDEEEDEDEQELAMELGLNLPGNNEEGEDEENEEEKDDEEENKEDQENDGDQDEANVKEEDEEENEEDLEIPKKKRQRTDDDQSTGTIHDEELVEEDKDEEDIVIKKTKKLTKEQILKQRIKSIKLLLRRPSYSTLPTSLLLLSPLQARLTYTGPSLPWQACLALTDRYHKGTISELQYNILCDYLKLELGDQASSDRNRYTVTEGMNDPDTDSGNPTTASLKGAQAGSMTPIIEFRFFLHKHWSLYNSMIHSSYMFSKLNLWKGERGEVKLKELLAEIGIRLQDCSQPFTYLGPERIAHFNEVLRDPVLLSKYDLNNPPITYKSFTRAGLVNYNRPWSAFDVVEAINSLLESSNFNKIHYNNSQEDDVNSTSENDDEELSLFQKLFLNKQKHINNLFYNSYDALIMKEEKVLNTGINISLELQQAIIVKLTTLLSENHSEIHKLHRLYFSYVQSQEQNKSNFRESSVEIDIFTRPNVLAKLARYIVESKRSIPRTDGGWSGSALLPLILLSPRVTLNKTSLTSSIFKNEETIDYCYVYAINPNQCSFHNLDIAPTVQEKLNILRNFRQFFRLAAHELDIEIIFPTFDHSICMIPYGDAQDFIGQLDSLFEKATPTKKN